MILGGNSQQMPKQAPQQLAMTESSDMAYFQKEVVKPTCFELCFGERAGTLLGVSLKGAMNASSWGKPKEHRW